MKHTFTGTIEGDKHNRYFVPASPSWYQHSLSKFKPSQKVIVSIEDKKAQRSTQQNRFYWAYLEMIREETGNEVEDLHKYFKYKFLPKKQVKVYGDLVWQTGSTTKLNKLEFSEYMRNIEVLTGVLVPPTDNWDLAPTIGLSGLS